MFEYQHMFESIWDYWKLRHRSQVPSLILSSGYFVDVLLRVSGFFPPPKNMLISVKLCVHDAL